MATAERQTLIDKIAIALEAGAWFGSGPMSVGGNITATQGWIGYKVETGSRGPNLNCYGDPLPGRAGKMTTSAIEAARYFVWAIGPKQAHTCYRAYIERREI